MRTRTIHLPDGRSVSWRDSWWRIVARALGTAATVAALVAIAALLVVPKATGGSTLTVLTGSMRPTMAPGDVAVVRGITVEQVCSQVGVGQVITFLPTPGSPDLITHRVVALTVGDYPDGTSCQITTQGDANSAVDDPISPEQVRGVLMYKVPKVGLARAWVGDNTQAVMVAGAIAAIAYGLWTALRRPRTRVVTIPGTSAEDQARERELALAHREAELDARELAFAQRTASHDTRSHDTRPTPADPGSIEVQQ